MKYTRVYAKCLQPPLPGEEEGFQAKAEPGSVSEKSFEAMSGVEKYKSEGSDRLASMTGNGAC